MAGWLDSWTGGWLAGGAASWVAGWLARWPADWPSGQGLWLAGWVADWPAGWLVVFVASRVAGCWPVARTVWKVLPRAAAGVKGRASGRRAGGWRGLAAPPGNPFFQNNRADDTCIPAAIHVIARAWPVVLFWSFSSLKPITLFCAGDTCILVALHVFARRYM